MKRLLISLITIGAVGVAAVGASNAFFSDTETSTANTITAGAIDLNIDNTSYYNGVASQGTTWTTNDLTIQKFFNFSDVKPGDWGEDTISVHVNNNNSWACANIKLTKNDDVSSTEPELTDGDVAEDLTNLFDGELAQNLNFVFWKDDGDNVLESGETASVVHREPLVDGFLTLSDSIGGLLSSQTPLVGGTDYFIGKAWCFGTIGLAPVANGANSPLGVIANSGISCNGLPLDNKTQSDMIEGDVSFYAVQSRNNTGFVCSDAVFVTPPPAP